MKIQKSQDVQLQRDLVCKLYQDFFGQQPEKKVTPQQFDKKVYTQFKKFQSRKGEKIQQIKKQKEIKDLIDNYPVNYRVCYDKDVQYKQNDPFLQRVLNDQEQRKEHFKNLIRIKQQFENYNQEKQLTFSPQINRKNNQSRSVDDLIQWQTNLQSKLDQLRKDKERQLENKPKIKANQVHYDKRYIKQKNQIGKVLPVKEKNISERLYMYKHYYDQNRKQKTKQLLKGLFYPDLTKPKSIKKKDKKIKSQSNQKRIKPKLDRQMTPKTQKFTRSIEQEFLVKNQQMEHKKDIDDLAFKKTSNIFKDQSEPQEINNNKNFDDKKKSQNESLKQDSLVNIIQVLDKTDEIKTKSNNKKLNSQKDSMSKKSQKVSQKYSIKDDGQSNISQSHRNYSLNTQFYNNLKVSELSELDNQKNKISVATQKNLSNPNKKKNTTFTQIHKNQLFSEDDEFQIEEDFEKLSQGKDINYQSNEDDLYQGKVDQQNTQKQNKSINSNKDIQNSSDQKSKNSSKQSMNKNSSKNSCQQSQNYCNLQPQNLYSEESQQDSEESKNKTIDVILNSGVSQSKSSQHNFQSSQDQYKNINPQYINNRSDTDKSIMKEIYNFVEKEQYKESALFDDNINMSNSQQQIYKNSFKKNKIK